MNVRPATPDDAAALCLVHAEAWADTYVGHVPEVVAKERLARARCRDWVEHRRLRLRLGGDVFVADVGDDITGFCEFGPTEDADDDPARVGHIMRLYVRPRNQGSGFGRRLLEEACDALATRGHVQATLWTPEPRWNRAHGFYQRLGWNVEEARNGDDPPDIRYRRRIL